MVVTPDFLWRKENRTVLERDFVLMKIDTERMTDGKKVGLTLRGSAGGIPWFAFLDAAGKKLMTSDGPAGNIGCPATPEEIGHFKTMLSKTVKRISPEDIDKPRCSMILVLADAEWD